MYLLCTQPWQRCFFCFFIDTAPPNISPLPLPHPLTLGPATSTRTPAAPRRGGARRRRPTTGTSPSPTSSRSPRRSEQHTSELQSRQYLVCRLLLEKKKHSHVNSQNIRACSSAHLAISHV